MSNDNTETIATFEHHGDLYELDDLRICRPSQAGMYAVYRDGRQVAEFELTAGTEHTPPPAGVLVAMSRQVLDTR